MKRKPIIVILIAMLLACVLLAAPASADPGWSYYRTITIDYTKVEATLPNFPVLISITDTDLRDHAQSDGSDIVFTDNSNTVKYDHEIENYDGPAGTLVAWLSILSLSGSTDTTFRMCRPVEPNRCLGFQLQDGAAYG